METPENKPETSPKSTPDDIAITPAWALQNFAPELRIQIICLEDILNFSVFFHLEYTRKRISTAIKSLRELAYLHFRIDTEVSAGRYLPPSQTLSGLIADGITRSLRLLDSPFIWRMQQDNREEFVTALRAAHGALELAQNRYKALALTD